MTADDTELLDHYVRRGAAASHLSLEAAWLDYDKDGRLIITRGHEAWDPEVAAKRTLRAITEKKVKTVEGNDIPMRADCICVHSDTPGAVEVAKAVRTAIASYLN